MTEQPMEGDHTEQGKNSSRSHGLSDGHLNILYTKLIEAEDKEKKAIGEFIKNYEETHTNKIKQINQEEIKNIPVVIESTDGHDGHKDAIIEVKKSQENVVTEPIIDRNTIPAVERKTIPIKDRNTIPIVAVQAKIQEEPTVKEKTIVRDRERIKYEKRIAAMEARKIVLGQKIAELKRKIEIERQKNSRIFKKS